MERFLLLENEYIDLSLSPSGNTYVLIILASASSTSSLDDFRDCQACLLSLSQSSRLGIALGATTLQPGGRTQVTTSLEHYYVTTARAVSSQSPSVYRLFPYRASKSPKRAPRSVSRAPRARDADEEEHEEGNGGEERDEQAPPIESTCSPAIVAISIVAIPIVACRRNAPRSDPGIPVGLASRILPRTPGYSFTSTTLARLHARRPLSTFQRGAYETFWVTRFRLSATWNEVSALSEAAPRVRSGLNIATCLRRRSRKV